MGCANWQTLNGISLSLQWFTRKALWGLNSADGESCSIAPCTWSRGDTPDKLLKQRWWVGFVSTSREMWISRLLSTDIRMSVESSLEIHFSIHLPIHYYGIWYCICFWVILRKLCHLCFVSPWLTMIELRGHWTWASYLIDLDCNGNLLMFLFLPQFFIIYKMFINNIVKKILLQLLFEIKTFFYSVHFQIFFPWHYSLLNITV